MLCAFVRCTWPVVHSKHRCSQLTQLKDSPSSSQLTQFSQVCTLHYSKIIIIIFFISSLHFQPQFPPRTSHHWSVHVRFPIHHGSSCFLLWARGLGQALCLQGLVQGHSNPGFPHFSLRHSPRPMVFVSSPFLSHSFFILFNAGFACLSLFVTSDLVPILGFSNRAFCYSKLELHKHVIKDCDRALQLDPSLLRAYILKGFLIFSSNLIPLSI